ncbi:MAG: SAM-dependent methyltransferase [Clostridia bacterium]|nr:SAM-dependent methyltransferase [Clostridia bacterium]
MENNPLDDLLSLVSLAAEGGALRRLVLSRPTDARAPKVTGRLCAFRGETVLALESAEADGKVYHSRLAVPTDAAALRELCVPYAQINLLTAAGDAEYRRATSGKETLLCKRPLRSALSTVGVTLPTEGLDRKKRHLLSGDEPFLRYLGIADGGGRIHDKKQAKFRQINRFLEHVEAILPALPPEGPLTVYDLCCGKSYLSFAVYHYLKNVLGREVDMLCLDLKQDVMDFCAEAAKALGFSGMRFLCEDVRRTPAGHPHLVISLHSCDVATDLVLGTAIALGADAVLSTPCCHRTLARYLSCPPLAFAAREPQLCQKLAESLTDGLRALRLTAAGYRVTATELTDPDDTPKNTLLRAVRDTGRGEAERRARAEDEYREALAYLFSDRADDYLAAIQ